MQSERLFNLHVFYLTQEKLKKERLTSIRLSKMCIDVHFFFFNCYHHLCDVNYLFYSDL